VRKRLAAWLAPRLPAGAKRGLRRVDDLADRLTVARHRRATGDRRPVPPVSLRERVGASSVASYFEAGARWSHAIDSCLEAVGDSIAAHRRALDFGCGSGKVLQDLSERTELELSGADLHAPSVQWVAANYPGVRAVANGYSPPLPFEEGEFDLVYAWSVFTHLPEEPQFEWLRELGRVLSADGVLLASVHTRPPSRSAAPPREEAGELIRDRDFAFARRRSGDETGWLGTSEDYGHAIHTPEYVESRWGEILDVVAILEGGLSGQQDVVVLRQHR
jgi:SAM-dependent methyltransferase